MKLKPGQKFLLVDETTRKSRNSVSLILSVDEHQGTCTWLWTDNFRLTHHDTIKKIQHAIKHYWVPLKSVENDFNKWLVAK